MWWCGVVWWARTADFNDRAERRPFVHRRNYSTATFSPLVGSSPVARASASHAADPTALDPIAQGEELTGLILPAHTTSTSPSSTAATATAVTGSVEVARTAFGASKESGKSGPAPSTASTVVPILPAHTLPTSDGVAPTPTTATTSTVTSVLVLPADSPTPPLSAASAPGSGKLVAGSEPSTDALVLARGFSEPVPTASSAPGTPSHRPASPRRPGLSAALAAAGSPLPPARVLATPPVRHHHLHTAADAHGTEHGAGAGAGAGAGSSSSALTTTTATTSSGRPPIRWLSTVKRVVDFRDLAHDIGDVWKTDSAKLAQAAAKSKQLHVKGGSPALAPAAANSSPVLPAVTLDSSAAANSNVPTL
jgi:hypothetical protein